MRQFRRNSPPERRAQATTATLGTARIIAAALAITLLWPSWSPAQTSANFAIRGATLNGGGGRATSAGFLLNGCLLPDPITGGRTTSASFVLASGCAVGPTSTSTCGNSTVEGAEACDDGNTANGDCCSATCQFEPSTTVCRALDGVCDVPETCTGTSATCPGNSFAPTTTVCRGAGGICDAQETCTGTAASCPSDGFSPSTTPCRAAGSVCDVVENCTGSSGTCPGNAFAPTATVCREAGGVCDVQETCTGTAASCPADSFVPSTAVCRADAGECDNAENCTGSTAACPADSGDPPGTVCGDPTDTECTNPDTCDGAGACQPNDAAPGTPCQDSSACTLGDVCGAAGACDSGGLLDCDDANVCTQDSCDPDTGCVNDPAPRLTTADVGGTCRTANSTAVSIKVSSDGSGTIKWKWLSGQATELEDYGQPDAGTAYTLCIYDSVGDVSFLPLPGLGEANDGKQVGPGSGWESAGEDTGWKYKNTNCDEEGVAGVTLTPGEDTHARITLKAKGQCNAVPIPCSDAGAGIPCTGKFFHMDKSVVVQLVNDDTAVDPLGECWHSGFGDENTVFKNVPQKFKSKRHVKVQVPQ